MHTPPSINEALRKSPLPLGESRILLATILGGVSTAYLIAHSEVLLTPEQALKFKEWVEERQQGKPIAYLVEQREFWGRPFITRPGVLIPRPDTETLVEAALEALPPKAEGWALDLGCGSGILAITLACERPNLNVVAIDRSSIAVKTTQENAQKNQVADRLHVIQSDWLSALVPIPRFSLIVSNPPYIDPADPHLNQGDLRFEPIEALRADQQGYADLFYLIGSAADYLIPGGWLWLEHGYNQGSPCYSQFNRAYWNQPEQRHDLSGWTRVTGAQKR